MVRDDVTTQYIEGAGQGFVFRELGASVIEKDVKTLRRKRIFKILLMIGHLAPMVLVTFFTSNDYLNLAIYLYVAVVAFVFLVYIWQDTSNIKDLKNGKMYAFDVEVIKILPVETASVLGIDSSTTTEWFYPIVGRDVISGYEDKCYVEEKVYKEIRCGDVITLQRKFSKRDLRKQNITVQR